MERQLVTIRTVSALTPIVGADVIELASIDGWNCVVKSGEFEVGSLGVFFEIDSYLPAEDPRFAFLENKFKVWEGKRGHRLKTIKLKGVLSQGLLLPLSSFPEINPEDSLIDLAALLNVQKWERSLHPSLAGTICGNFPSFLVKTDEERCQNIPNVISAHTDTTFEATTKLDGSSCTMYYLQEGSPYLKEGEPESSGRFGVCSRNLDIKETEGNAFWQAARKYGVEEKLRSLPYSVAIQGELIGPNIQSNYEKVTENQFYVFKVFNVETQEFRLPELRRFFCNVLGLPHVPVIAESISLSDTFTSTKDILDYAEGPGMNPGVKREGVVFKSNDYNFSFKAISNSYLLKEKD